MYVIHKGNRPANNVITIDEENVCNSHLQGPAFNVESNTVLTLLKDLCNGTNGDTWIKGIQFGKAVIRAL